jgi:germination protein M
MKGKKFFCLILVFVSILLLAGCDANAPKPEKEAMSQSPSVNQQQESGLAGAGTPAAVSNEQVPKTMPIIIYQADKEALHLIPESHVVPFDNHPAQTALALLIAGTRNPELVSVIPPGTEVLGVTIKEHIAYVNFNDKLKNHGGSTSEILLVGAIVDTLTQFPEIQKVQILVNDKRVDTLSGHLDVSEPLSRVEQIIKK